MHELPLTAPAKFSRSSRVPPLRTGVTPAASLQAGWDRQPVFLPPLDRERSAPSICPPALGRPALLDYEGLGQGAGSYSHVPRSCPEEGADHGVGAEKGLMQSPFSIPPSPCPWMLTQTTASPGIPFLGFAGGSHPREAREPGERSGHLLPLISTAPRWASRVSQLPRLTWHLPLPVCQAC